MRTKTRNFNNSNNTKRIFSGLAWLSISVLFCVMLLSYSSSDPSLNQATSNLPKNLLGIFGSYTSDLLLQIFGVSAVLFAIFPLVWGTQTLMKEEIKYFWLRLIAASISIITLSGVLAGSGDQNIHFIIYGGMIGKAISISTESFNKNYALSIEVALLALSSYIALNIELKSMLLFLYKAFIYILKTIAYLWHIVRTTYKVINIKSTDSPAISESKQQKNEEHGDILKQEITNNDIKPILKPETYKKPILPNIRAGNFSLPSSDLLNSYNKQKSNNHSEKTLQTRSSELVKILNDFGVQGKIVSFSPGPVVTLYEFEPAAGVKSSRVIGLAGDIARVMRALSTRISIIPGKNSLGIELPNDHREIVYMREAVESQEYITCTHKLPLILGEDIGGKNVIVDLASMPHLLVAGTTGSGKSVAINTMILSLLFKHTSEECKFVMIDPKMLELSVYQGIPHLLSPVVTEPGKAVIALKWTVKEMENRYRLMSNLNVRNIEGYNQKIEEAVSKGTSLSKKVQIGFDPETGKPIYETIEIEKKKLPFIVVIVDEMADLMIVAGKDIESSIQRLAQMARAAGIHIIMATQRPSVDVITGVIKANFPTRISFQVTSKIDSRTILGEMGAEQLLGKGDMLYMAGGNKIRRVHSPFVADSEVERVVSFLKSQGEPSYSVDITSESQLSDSSAGDASGKDELYDQAVSLVLREQKASTSFLQRCFKIGYNRAATIMEQMERRGVVGSPNHVGKREILLNQ